MTKNKVTLSVRINGRDAREYTNLGRTFIEGRESTSYSLYLRNDNGFRAKAVISVDGINIITGKPTTDDPEETGYLMEAYGNNTYKGFRVDDNKVAAFVFGASKGSYADTKGKGSSNGVIAMRVYREKYVAPTYAHRVPRISPLRSVPLNPEPSWPPLNPRSDFYYGGGGSTSDSVTDSFMGFDPPLMDSPRGLLDSSVSKQSRRLSKGFGFAPTSFSSVSNDSLMSASLENSEPAANAFNLGTHWGSSLEERVRTVSFTTGALLAEMTIYYSDVEGLTVLGIDLNPKPAVAFPEAFERKEYCAPPVGWQG